VRRNVILLNGKLFSKQASIELEVHRKEVFMWSKQFFPTLYSLKNLCLDSRFKSLTHEDAGYFKEELFSGDLRVKGQLAAVGEIFEEVEAVEENFGVADGETFRNCVEGMFGPEWKRKYMSTREFMISRIF
jgi:hypothetical protein